MVKIEHFSLKGYKNVKEADISFNNFNVIIGANNSGKSNFLQSISFLNYVINGATDEVEKDFNEGFYQSFYKTPEPSIDLSALNENTKHGQIEFKLKFSNSETNSSFTYHLELEYKEEVLAATKYKIKAESLEIKENGKPGKAVNVFNRVKEHVKYGVELPKLGFSVVPDYFSIVRLLKLLPKKGLYLDAIDSLSKILKTPTFYFSNTELMKSEFSERLNVFNGRTIAFDLEQEIINLAETDRWGIFKSALKSVLNIDEAFVITYIVRHDASDNKKLVYLEQFGIRKTVRQLSDGSILVLALITKVLNSENDIYFIEEPENSTHPKALIDLIHFLQSFSESKQFVITSHSIPLLNKTRIDDIITSVVGNDGRSEIQNVKDQKELKSRLKSSHVNFSDELFFVNHEDEFE